MKNRPIGVFDSGVGGLTVLSKLIDVLPNEDYIYIADHLNCPYGTKTYFEIKEYCIKICDFFIKEKVKAIVIACNTASVMKEDLMKIYNIPIISVIEPTVLTIVNKTVNQNVLVLGTKFTIDSRKYENLLIKKGINTTNINCDEFVQLVENGNLEFDSLSIIKEKLSNINENIDTVVYGCTHFELLEKYIRLVLGEKYYISCGKPTGLALKKILETKDLLNEKQKGGIVFYSTNLKKINRKTLEFFEIENLNFEQIIL